MKALTWTSTLLATSSLLLVSPTYAQQRKSTPQLSPGGYEKTVPAESQGIQASASASAAGFAAGGGTGGLNGFTFNSNSQVSAASTPNNAKPIGRTIATTRTSDR